MRRCAMALVLGFSLAAEPCTAEVRLRDYEQVRATERFRSYLHGVGIGYLWANSTFYLDSGRRLFCLPDHVRLDASGFLDILDRQIRSDAATGVLNEPDTAVELLLLQGLRREFPCQEHTVRRFVEGEPGQPDGRVRLTNATFRRGTRFALVRPVSDTGRSNHECRLPSCNTAGHQHV